MGTLFERLPKEVPHAWPCRSSPQTATVPPIGFLGITLGGALLLVGIAAVYHRLPPRVDHPRRG
jgi:hypothetical protein